jgi:hypothetical protein
MTMEPTEKPLLITAFIDCSPLGLFCRVCKVAFSSNETARRHLKLNHRKANSSTNREDVQKLFKELRENANILSLDEWMVGNPKNGGECSACREFNLHKFAKANSKT